MSLIECAKAADYEGVKKAVAEGQDVNQVDESGNTALMCMAYQGNFELVKMLVDAGAEPYLECQAIGRKGLVAMDFALQAMEQDNRVKTDSCVDFSKIVALLTPPDAEEDELRGAEELESRFPAPKLKNAQ